MFSVSGYFISGVMVGVELLTAEDVNDKNVSFSVVVDLFIVRLQFTLYKGEPHGFA